MVRMWLFSLISCADRLSLSSFFSDETDAWLGYILGWNIAYWYTDICSYFTRVRRELEEKTGGDLEDDDGDEEESRPMGRGQRKKRKLVSEREPEEEEEEEEWEQLPPEWMSENQPTHDRRPDADATHDNDDQPQPKKTKLDESPCMPPASSHAAASSSTPGNANLPLASSDL